MTEAENLKRLLDRWRLTALLAVAFAIGVIASPYFGIAVANSPGGKVQLDTSNCTSDYVVGNNPPEGVMVMQVFPADRAWETIWLFNDCR